MTKLLPYYPFQTDAIEGWLDEQAKQGLFLTECAWKLAAAFERGEPKAVRYRIDVKRDSGCYGEQERIAAYRELGWEYVCELTAELDVYRCDDPDAPELNTDEETLHQVLDGKLKRAVIQAVVILCLLPLWVYWALLRDMPTFESASDMLSSGYGWLYLAGFLAMLTWLLDDAATIAGAVSARRRRLLKRAYHTPSELRRWRAVRWATVLLPLIALTVLLALGIVMR